MNQLAGWLLGYERLRSLESIEFQLAAPWAADRIWLVLVGCAAAVAAAIWFYGRGAAQRAPRTRLLLMGLRAALLVLLVVTIAAPLVRSSATVVQPPLVCLLVDHTASMSVGDYPAHKRGGNQPDTRSLRVQQVLQGRQGLIQRLQELHDCEVVTLAYDGDAALRLRRLSPADLNRLADDPADHSEQRTDFAALLEHLPLQLDGQAVTATILVSDFADNVAGSPLRQAHELLAERAAPVHTVGVGNTDFVAVHLRGENQVKRGEPTRLQVDLTHRGLTGSDIRLRLESRPLAGRTLEAEAPWSPLDERTISPADESQTETFSFTPTVAGQIEIRVEAASLSQPESIATAHAQRVISSLDQPLRLFYVADEPAWEWRFVKEVFHRDELVGLRGFRTYLASADPQVRQSSDLFLSELTAPRREFFQHDVILLGDASSELLTAEFCDLVEEFVGDFGGGLVFLAGPRAGPQALAGTRLADMLPVVLDADAELRDEREFSPLRTPAAERFPFMRLADTPAEQNRAWKNLDRLPWYQPVAAVHEQAAVLVEHPRDVCLDGQTRQPLIAIRPYGNGQVVYLGFDEMWRLRRQFGDHYYQRFWSQLIYRLGMSHAIGDSKRFALRWDKNTYHPGEQAVLTLHAFDEDYRPLGLDEVNAETHAWSMPAAGIDTEKQHYQFSERQPGVFTALMEFPTPGRHTGGITDPVTGEEHAFSIVVEDTAVERLQTARDLSLQQRIAEASGGGSYELSETERLLADLQLPTLATREHRQLALWTTPLWFVLAVGLMLSEWTVRRLVYLR